MAWIISVLGEKSALILLIVPVIVPIVAIMFKRLDLILYSAISMGFFTSMMSRYIPGIPFGLSIDGLLALTIIACIFHNGVKWKSKYLYNGLTAALLFWLVFTVFMLANPSATKPIAWFYANRGLSFYPFLFAILTLYVLKQPYHLKYFLILWASFAVLGTFWGIKQQFLGLSQAEQYWLNSGAASTHIIFGKLRIFSFFSDCAQFAANQAHTSLVFGILGVYPGKIKYRWIYLVISFLSLYGMIITGTRGVLAILAIGGLTFLLFTKNFRIVIIGSIVAFTLFGILKYTYVGQSNYEIQRIRSALDFNDPSFQVRQERIQRLKSYLSDKPLGGGIGSAGYWGKRFSPGSFLGEIGTDGHYTRVWMETGRIGLTLYLTMIWIIMIYLGKRLWKMKHTFQKQILIALYAGFIGLIVASYTNGLMVQNPTGSLLFISLGMLYNFSKKTIRS
ncbi:MAG: O-antigen ligase family protein [Cyclobacteriaceae bacterium]